MSLARSIALAGSLLAPGVHAATAQSGTGNPIEGAWNFVPPLHGQMMYRGNSNVMFITRPDSAAVSTPPSEADQARLYRSMTLQSGTFSILDTIVTMNQTYGKNPRQVARSWRWIYTLKGDTLTWRVLDAQGRVTETGIALRAPGSR